MLLFHNQIIIFYLDSFDVTSRNIFSKVMFFCLFSDAWCCCVSDLIIDMGKVFGCGKNFFFNILWNTNMLNLFRHDICVVEWFPYWLVHRHQLLYVQTVTYFVFGSLVHIHIYLINTPSTHVANTDGQIISLKNKLASNSQIVIYTCDVKYDMYTWYKQ